MRAETPVDSSEPMRLQDQHYIRQKLYGGQKSALQRYAELVIGRMDIWELLKYRAPDFFAWPVPRRAWAISQKIVLPVAFSQHRTRRCVRKKRGH